MRLMLILPEIGNINIAGNQIDANDDLTLMSQVGDIILDAAGDDVLLKDSGTQYGALTPIQVI